VEHAPHYRVLRNPGGLRYRSQPRADDAVKIAAHLVIHGDVRRGLRNHSLSHFLLGLDRASPRAAIAAISTEREERAAIAGRFTTPYLLEELIEIL
jgi:hypothetical protein